MPKITTKCVAGKFWTIRDEFMELEDDDVMTGEALKELVKFRSRAGGI